MTKILCVAEKPSVAKAVANILSYSPSYTQTESKFNPVFQFDYEFENQISQMFFTSVTGHIKEYYSPPHLNSWQLETAEDFYKDEPLKRVCPDKQGINKNLLSYGRQCNILILWLDCDREGENIAFEVVETVQSVNRNIRILRAHFSTLAPRDIKLAMETLKPPDKNLSDAVEIRQKIDFIIGCSFTRLQTISFKSVLKEYSMFSSLESRKENNFVITYGPCQFPTLNFVVDRADQIRNFVQEEFYYLDLIIEKENSKTGDICSVSFNWERDRLYDRQIAYLFLLDCLEQLTGKITKVTKYERKRYRPIPLNTVEFTKLCSTKLKINAKQAMEIAEQLYRDGFISYPRTETQKFSKSINLKSLIKEQTKNSRWGDFAQRLLNDDNDNDNNNENNNNNNITSKRFKFPREGKQDDKSHPAIHPTKHLPDNHYPDRDKHKIYELITRYFLGCVTEDARGFETTVNYKISNEMFSSKGIEIVDKGYLEIYTFDSWGNKYIPDFSENEEIVPKSLKLLKGFTSPPNFLTESELITLMDNNGIGTDATIHDHINTVLKRNYCVRHGSSIRPTLLGFALLKAYKNIGVELYKPYIRANMEKRFKLICEGTQQCDATYEDIKKNMRLIFERVYEKLDSMISFLTVFCKNNKYYEKELAETYSKFNSVYREAIAGNNNNNGNNDDHDNRGGGGNRGNGGGNYPSDNYRNNGSNNNNNSNYNNNNKYKGDQNNNNNNYKNKRRNSYEATSSQKKPKKNLKIRTSTSAKTQKRYSNSNEKFYGVCSMCNKNLRLQQNRKTGFYFIGCTGYPNCKFIKNIGNPSQVNSQTERSCNTCKNYLFNCVSSNGSSNLKCIICDIFTEKRRENFDRESDDKMSKRNKNYPNNNDKNMFNFKKKNNNINDEEDNKKRKYVACNYCGKKRHNKNDDCEGKKTKTNKGRKKDDNDDDDFNDIEF